MELTDAGLYKAIQSDMRSYGICGFKGFIKYLLINRGFHLLTTYRAARFCYLRGGIFKLFLTPIRWYQMICFSSDISHKSLLGVGTKFPHPIGIVIGNGVIVGGECWIFQRVTLGGDGRDPNVKRYPTIGNRVRIFANAVVLGDVLVGNDAKVGANAVVLRDVPEGCSAVGVPARVV